MTNVRISPDLTRAAAAVWRFATIAAVLAALAGCDPVPRGSTEKNNLAAMATADVRIADRAHYTAYVADDNKTIQIGLMNTTSAQLAKDRGMIFDMGYDAFRSFWMRNTIIPLDIAFIRSDGTIVKVRTMQPLDETGYPSIEPARYALEVNAGQFAEWGVHEGDHVEIERDIPAGDPVRSDLTAMRTVPIEILNRTTYSAYVADNPRTRQLGLMNTPESDLPADRGMIFVFDDDRYQAFWMRNTIIPLDIAYINSDGLIVDAYTMEPLNEDGYPSESPARFVLEVRGGQFQEHGIAKGDHVRIPDALLNPPS